MTTPTWPDDVPCRFLRETLTVARQDNRISFQPEVGDAKVRRRFTAVVADYSGDLKCTVAQRDALNTFFDDTLMDGTLPFIWLDPMTNESATFRFLEPINWTSRAPQAWFASCKVRRLP